MPVPRLDDAVIEFSFNTDELINARILDPLKIAWYQTLYSRIWKQKSSIQVPESLELTLPYVQQICELEGRLGMIQQILDDHNAAMKEFNERKLQDPNLTESTVESTARRAANLVNKPN